MSPRLSAVAVAEVRLALDLDEYADRAEVIAREYLEHGRFMAAMCNAGQAFAARSIARQLRSEPLTDGLFDLINKIKRRERAHRTGVGVTN